MKQIRLFAVFALLLLGSSATTRVAAAQDRATDKTPASTASSTSNPDMQRIFEEDQKARQGPPVSPAEGKLIYQKDQTRRVQVRDLLAKGALHTGKDFEQAVFVFQHGGGPDDYLLAHTLAIIAVARGNSGAIWIAAATLDRYLGAMKQPQIYGTQFHKTKDTPWTQEPYNRSLISDALRDQLGVPSEAAQQDQLESYKSAGSH